MNLLLDPQIVAALLTVALTAIAAAAGYFLREHIARTKPFLAITRIDGDTRRHGTRIDVPKNVTSALKNTSLQTALSERAALPDIGTSLLMANDIRDEGPLFCDLVTQFRTAAAAGDTAVAQSLLADIMTSESFDHWISLMIGEREVQIPPYDPAAQILIDCSEEPNTRGGTFSIGFPGRSIRFGSSLNDFALYRTGIASFIELVKRMELAKLRSLLDQMATRVAGDVVVAKEVIPALQSIVDSHSQWAGEVYLANLGSTPFLVQLKGSLEIVDRNGGRYSEPCSLLLIETDPDGDRSRTEAVSPLVVRSESDIIFEFVTDHVQSEMSAGDAVRALYKAGSAQCRICFSVHRVGLKRVDEFVTPYVPFTDK